MIKRVLLALPFLLAAYGVNAQDAAAVQGTWKLTSFVMVDEATKEKVPAYGDKPNGYLTLLPEGRMYLVLTGTGRAAPKTDEDRIAAFKSMVAYTGTYKIEGDAFTTKVDAAWNEAWVGTDQKRTFKLNGDTLEIISMTQPAVNFGNKMMHGEQVWSRVK